MMLWRFQNIEAKGVTLKRLILQKFRVYPCTLVARLLLILFTLCMLGGKKEALTKMRWSHLMRRSLERLLSTLYYSGLLLVVRSLVGGTYQCFHSQWPSCLPSHHLRRPLRLNLAIKDRRMNVRSTCSSHPPRLHPHGCTDFKRKGFPSARHYCSLLASGDSNVLGSHPGPDYSFPSHQSCLKIEVTQMSWALIQVLISRFTSHQSCLKIEVTIWSSRVFLLFHGTVVNPKVLSLQVWIELFCMFLSFYLGVG